MNQANIAEREHSQKALSILRKGFTSLFEYAPVMMHSIDETGKLERVNRRWRRRLGYKKTEVLGKRSVDFMTEESRDRAIRETLPLFWRVGSARSVGYQMVRKDGGIVDVLLDAELVRVGPEKWFTLATLCDSYDPTQWEHAAATLKTLKDVAFMQETLERTLSEKGDVPLGLEPSTGRQLAGMGSSGLLAEEMGGDLLESLRDVAGNLRGLLQVLEGWLEAAEEHQQETLAVLKGINKSISELVDVTAR